MFGWHVALILRSCSSPNPKRNSIRAASVASPFDQKSRLEHVTDLAPPVFDVGHRYGRTADQGLRLGVDHRKIEASSGRGFLACQYLTEEGARVLSAVRPPIHELRDYGIRGIGMHRVLVDFNELSQYQSVADQPGRVIPHTPIAPDVELTFRPV